MISVDSISSIEVSSVNTKFWKNLVRIGVTEGRFHTNFDQISRETHERIAATDFQGNDATHFDTKTGKFYHFEIKNESSSQFLQKGDHVTITGTVKEHSEYNETKQTRLQRVKIS